MRQRKLTIKLMVALSCLSVGACSTVAITEAPPAAPKEWLTSGGSVQSTDGQILQRWWKRLGDVDLDWLIEQAMKQSPDIRQAAARLAEARGLEKAGFAALFPQLSGNAGYQRQRTTFIAPVTGNSYSATFDASYEIDLFGKNSEAWKAADLVQDAAAQDYAWVRLSQIAEITRVYVAMRAAEKQSLLAEKNLEIEKNTLDLVKHQYQAGGSSAFDVERTSLQVSQTAARISDYQRQRDIFEISLITLTGLDEAAIRAQLKPSAEIPGIDLAAIADAPALVLARRPDIIAANLRFTEATALKEAQAAAIFPTVSISGLFGLSKLAFLDPSTIWNLGGNASVSLLDFGRIQGQIDASSARERSAFEFWRKAILQGVQDVETALTNASHIQQQRVSLHQARDHAAKALNLAQTRYRAGDISLLDVLDAQRQLIDTDSTLIDAENSYVSAIIALHKALGQY